MPECRSRAGPWKVYLPLKEKLINLAHRTAPATLALYDLRSDVAETREVSAEHPDVVTRLLALAERVRGEIGDGTTAGTGQRPAGAVENPQPLLLEAPPKILPPR